MVLRGSAIRLGRDAGELEQKEKVTIQENLSQLGLSDEAYEIFPRDRLIKAMRVEVES